MQASPENGLVTQIHHIRYGGGAQTIVGIPVGEDGRPALPSGDGTYTIVDLRYGEDNSDRTVQSSTAGSLDSTTTTITAAAGPGQADKRKLVVDDATGIAAGDRLLLTDGDTGRTLLVEIANVAGSNLYTTAPIPSVFASGSTVQGIEVSATFPAVEANDEDRFDDGGGPYAIDWVWEGVTPSRQRDIVWVRRHPDLQAIATVEDCSLPDPSLPELVASIASGTAADKILRQAHLDLWAALRGAGFDPHAYDGPLAVEYVKYRFCYHGRKLLGSDVDEYNDRMQSEHYKAAQGVLASILGTGKHPRDTVITEPVDDRDAARGISSNLFGLT